MQFVMVNVQHFVKELVKVVAQQHVVGCVVDVMALAQGIVWGV